MSVADENSKPAVATWFWIALVFAVGSALFLTYAIHNKVVSDREQTVAGEIVPSLRPRDQYAYEYIFATQGNLFEGISYQISDEIYSAGQPVTVYFDPKNPYDAALSSFSTRIVAPGVSAILSALFSSASLFRGVIIWRRSTRRA